MVLRKSGFDGLPDLSFTITFGGRVTFLFSLMIRLICCTVNEMSASQSVALCTSYLFA